MVDNITRGLPVKKRKVAFIPEAKAPTALPGSPVIIYVAQTPKENLEDHNPLFVSPEIIEFEIHDSEKMIASYRYTDDEEAYKRFIKFLDEYSNIQIVSYAGRTFFFPRLFAVAMKLGINLKKVFATGDRYNSYLTRYSSKYHLDLLDAITNYGAITHPSLKDTYQYMNDIADTDTSHMEMIKNIHKKWMAIQ